MYDVTLSGSRFANSARVPSIRIDLIFQCSYLMIYSNETSKPVMDETMHLLNNEYFNEQSYVLKLFMNCK